MVISDIDPDTGLVVTIDEETASTGLEAVTQQSTVSSDKKNKQNTGPERHTKRVNSPVTYIRPNALEESNYIYVFVGSGKQNAPAYLDIVLKNPDKEKRKDFSRFLKGISSHLEISRRQTYQINASSKDDSGEGEARLEVIVYDVHKGITTMRNFERKIDGVRIEEAISSINGDASLDARLKGIKDYFSGNAFYRLK